MKKRLALFLLFAVQIVMVCCGPACGAAQPPRTAVMLGHYPDGPHSPNPSQTARVQVAARLYHRGLVQTIVVSGGFTFGHISEARMARIGLVALGVPDTAIVEEDRSATTVENAYFTSLLFQDRGWDKNAALVSQSAHLMRAKLNFEDKGFTVRNVVAPYSPAPDYEYPAAPGDIPASATAPAIVILYEPYHGDEPLDAPDEGMVRRARAAAAAWRAGAAPRIVVFADWYTRGAADPAETLAVALPCLGVDPAAIEVLGRVHYANLPWLIEKYGQTPALLIAPPGVRAPEAWTPWLIP
jgi:uncharacterized SAM-binding protein YcdF (DUF218 family)